MAPHLAPTQAFLNEPGSSPLVSPGAASGHGTPSGRRPMWKLPSGRPNDLELPSGPSSPAAASGSHTGSAGFSRIGSTSRAAAHAPGAAGLSTGAAAGGDSRSGGGGGDESRSGGGGDGGGDGAGGGSGGGGSAWGVPQADPVVRRLHREDDA
eukprot:359651-Chlamydomonas_euryale.AAC.3